MVIVGGGWAGFGAAEGLAGLAAQGKVDVTLLEAAPRAGGLAAAWKTPGGRKVEAGIHGFWRNYRNIDRLVEDSLGLTGSNSPFTPFTESTLFTTRGRAVVAPELGEVVRHARGLPRRRAQFLVQLLDAHHAPQLRCAQGLGEVRPLLQHFDELLAHVRHRLAVAPRHGPELDERAPPLRIDFEVEGAGGEYTLGGALRPRRWLYYYLCAGWAVHAWVTSTKWFAALVLASILTVGVTTGLLLDGVLDPHAPVARGVGTATLAVFTLEVSLKVLACGPRPAYFVTAPRGEGSMNAFDFLLVAASFALLAFDSESTRQSLLLVRLMRLMTIVDFVPELKVIVAGLATGLKSVGYIVALLLLIIYLFGIMAVQFFGSNDPANFGTVPVAPRRSSTTDILSSPPGRSQTYEPSPSYTVSSPSASASCVASTSSFATAASTFDGQ